MGLARVIWVIEDFHKLEKKERAKLSQALKVFVDMGSEYRGLHVVVTGATDTAREIVELDGEMSTRVAEIHVPMLTRPELEKILQGGSELLRVNFDEVREDILSYSAGLSSVCHQFALNACLSAGLEATATQMIKITKDDLASAVAQYLADSSDTLKARFEQAMQRQRVRTYDNTEFILGALAFGSAEGMTRAEILTEIHRHAPKYPSSNLTNYLRQLVDDESRGSVVRKTAGGKYRFAEPLLQSYAQTALQIHPSYVDPSVDVFLKLLDSSKLFEQLTNDIAHAKSIRWERNIEVEPENDNVEGSD